MADQETKEKIDQDRGADVDRNVANVESRQFAGASGFRDLAIDGMRQRHQRPVLRYLRIGAASPNVRKEAGRRPEGIDLRVVLYSGPAVQVVGIVKRIRKYKRGEQDEHGHMNDAEIRACEPMLLAAGSDSSGPFAHRLPWVLALEQALETSRGALRALWCGLPRQHPAHEGTWSTLRRPFAQVTSSSAQGSTPTAPCRRG